MMMMIMRYPCEHVQKSNLVHSTCRPAAKNLKSKIEISLAKDSTSFHGECLCRPAAKTLKLKI